MFIKSIKAKDIRTGMRIQTGGYEGDYSRVNRVLKYHNSKIVKVIYHTGVEEEFDFNEEVENILDAY